MLKQVDKCRRVSQVKTARFKYEQSVYESQSIAAQMDVLIQEKQVLMVPVFCKNMIALKRLDYINKDLDILRTEHEKAVDKVILERDYFLKTQSEILEDMELNPQKYLPGK